MQKPARINRQTKNKIKHARAIVRLCMQVAHKRLKPEFVDLVAEHVIQNLPPSILRQLTKSPWGQAMWPAMKLTRRYLA